MSPRQLVRRGANATVEFWRGAADPWRATRFLLGNPRLWVWAAIPFFLSLTLYVLIFFFGWRYLGGYLDRSFLHEEWYRQALGYFLAVLFWVLGLVLAALAFIPIASLVANPFNDILSEKTERIYRGVNAEEKFSLAFVWRAIRVGMVGEIVRTITVSILLVFAWSLNFVPVIGTFMATGLGTLITIAFLSLEYTSFSMDRRVYSWENKKRFLREYRPRTLGFGAMTFLILMTPVINAVFIPISAVAGTLLFCDTELNRISLPDPDHTITPESR